LPALGQLVGSLSIANRVPQIEVAAGDTACALVLRVLEPLSESDLDKLRAFEREHPVTLYLQPKGPDSIVPLTAPADLWYALPEFDVRIRFEPSDFVQVNAALNRAMVSRALALLAPEAGDRVLDLFAGLGNFTLPLSTRAGQVLAVEGDEALTVRAARNAELAGADNVEHRVANLFDPNALGFVADGWDRALLDPPRAGALEACRALGRAGVPVIVYVSCHAATLARDAAELTAGHGYRLESAGVMDMFPQTGHLESIAVFRRG
jgi:23S rRNA (uracil1939-C5)-methyltransferase